LPHPEPVDRPTYDRRDFVVDRIRTTPVAWFGHTELTQREWKDFGSRLGRASSRTSWWIGDWMRFGQRHYGDHRFEAAARITGYEVQTVRNFAYVAGRFEFSRRRENLSWSHHSEVAPLALSEQERWLDQAAREHLTVRAVRMRVGRERNAAVARLGINAAGPHSGDQPQPQVLILCPRCGQVIVHAG
jgi:hypothetical protein